MIRRGFDVVRRLVLGTILVAMAGSQAAAESATLADRMAAIRRGWAEDESAPPDAATSRSDNRSLLPNWFGRRDDEQSTGRPNGPAARNNTRPQQNSAGRYNTASPAPAASNAPPRVASVPRAGSAITSTADGFTLPGLGGSPLPPNARSAIRSGPTSSQQAPPDAADYPVIRDITPRNQLSDTNASSAANQHGATNGSAARQSPARHISSNVDPQDVRRDLAGTFSGSSTKSGPAARTARADDQTAVTEGELEAVDASTTPEQKSPPSAALPALAAPAQLPVDRNNFSAASNDAASPAITPVDENPAGDSTARPGTASDNQPTFGASQFIRSPRSNPLPIAPSAARSKEAFGEALQVANGGDPSVLTSSHTPIISSDIRGPKQILVGREAVFRVRLQNQSTAAAEQLVATVRIPAWAEVIETTATQGTIQPATNAGTPTQLEWRLARLEARGSEVLDIRLVPRESKPLELGVSWTVAPVGSRTVVEVQEPKLKIEVNGPNEVLFDKPQVFELTLSNPGSGLAENVKIDLVPPGGAQESATTHAMGDLPPGESKTVEIELTAREAGKLMVKAIASAEGGLVSDVSKEIFCRKPELELDWRGPATKYAGTVATYFFRVRNPGTAPAEDVTVKATLPEGAEFTSASEGQAFDAKTREVAWHVGTLGPGDDTYMELKCVVKAPGANQMQVAAATAAGDLTNSQQVETEVVALADLKLQVSDPSGPVAVGSQAVYEIHVENRGTNTAKNVNIVALFSDGIEPDQADGAMYTVADGRVSFRTIEELRAGRDITLRIRAHAIKPGTHVFRAEVLCSDQEIKLAAEETTRFYADDVVPDSDRPDDQSASRNSFEAAGR